MDQWEIYCMKMVTVLGKYDGKLHCFISLPFALGQHRLKQLLI
jgi:hypothetical protein